ncbi:phosphotransferase [Marinomonas pollencensis]|uniref:Ecdysteroid kinase n=1 Tax=Marinomonas pollencensis TaxID=491954 RepID=A0A3E0D9Y8_9GAMM|nr:phosphotransferase [Marinomonas pollencensis]REG79343.1 ecdysteroid kinase [Marinomonas pollencensis]
MIPDIFIKRQLNAQHVSYLTRIQSLWSGYGEIAKYQVNSGEQTKTVILKHIKIPDSVTHIRGWHSELAHQRKVKSYHVEAAWYQHWASRCSDECRVADCYGVYFSEETGNQYLLLEDLDEAGLANRHTQLAVEDCLVCLNWLAYFHGSFLHPVGQQSLPESDWPQGLWPTGTYWHLATRQDEWRAMEDGLLKQKANAISECLLKSNYRTLVHGDAKVANFCFSEDGRQVAAVDFQYVGMGIGVQDVAYFLGSALSEEDLNTALPYLLEHYFAELAQAIVARGESQDLATAVLEEWQSLFTLAWADFHRFIAGWCPDHKKNNAFSRAITAQALAELTAEY